MGGDLVKEPAHLSYTDIFEKTCPYYMAIGMTYEQFWDGEPSLTVAYLQAHQIKKDMDNEWLWLNGRYNFLAMTLAIGNAFRKEGTKPQDYPNKPFRIREMTAEEEEAERQRKIEETLAFFERSRVKSLNKEAQNGDT